MDNISILIQRGEDHRLELKESVAELAHEIVAFANADGGRILIGVADNGTISGTDLSNGALSKIQDIARNCDPPVKLKLIKHRETRIIEVLIGESSNKPHRCKEGFFLRNGPNSQKLSRDEIAALIYAYGNYSYDESMNEKFSYPEVFDPLKYHKLLAVIGAESQLAPDEIILNLDLGLCKNGKFYLNVAGVLFLAQNPQKLVKESSVTFIKYQGVDRADILDRKEIVGSIIQQIEDSVAMIGKYLTTSYSFTNELRRREKHDYPIIALREAITNAVMHRDYYYDMSHIYIHFFSDRIEIENPGGLMRGLTIDDLGKRSVRRNRVIADILYRCGYAEKIGSGISRMRKELTQNGNPPMEILTSNFFVVRIFPAIMSVSDADSLTERQKTILHFLSTQKALSAKQIAAQLGVSQDTTLRELARLLGNGYIEKQGVNKATLYKIGKFS